MCGICGIYNKDFEKKVQHSVLRKMADTITHRGPDEDGYYIEENVGLAIRRLKIIDLETGKQPITDGTGRYTIVFNGEIYNYLELRKELVNAGYPLKTKSDTEVILYEYIHSGPSCLEKFNGMFAIAIYDKFKRSLFLARDRIGIKPFFYIEKKGSFLFGSEIKCILQHPDVERNMDRTSLISHFLMNYIPDNQTLFEGIKSIPPAHFCHVNSKGISFKRYWKITPDKNTKIDFENAKHEFIELFQDSVRLRLRSDVPLGVFLSGGVDSSSVAAIAKRINPKSLHTFSVGFDEKSFDESFYSKLVSMHLRTTHHHLYIKPIVNEVLPKLVNHMEEPTADSSAVPVYYLSKYTREFVTVALSGDGADELAAGYETYSADYFARLLSWIPQFIVHGFHKTINFFPVSFEKYTISMKLERFLRGIHQDASMSHFLWRSIWYPHEIPLLLPDIEKNVVNTILNNYRLYFEQYPDIDLLSKSLLTDTTYYLPNDMLIKIDRMSMANSLEVRVPFLDHRLVEFFFRMPSEYKLKHLWYKKYLIKQSLKNHLPSEVIKRPKAGFNSPISFWFLTELKSLMNDLLSSQSTISIPFINWKHVSSEWNNHLKKKADNGYKLWSVLIFILWYRQFIEKRDVSI